MTFEIITIPCRSDNYAFLIEHRDQLGERINLQRNPAESTWIGNLVPEHTNLGSVFQYLIGNTDFSPISAEPGNPTSWIVPWRIRMT